MLVTAIELGPTLQSRPLANIPQPLETSECNDGNYIRDAVLVKISLDAQQPPRCMRDHAK